MEPQPIGALKAKPRRKGSVLTCDKPVPAKVAKVDLSRLTHAAEKLIGTRPNCSVSTGPGPILRSTSSSSAAWGALDHLTLGRAALYAAVPTSDSPSSLPLEGDAKSEGLFAAGHLRSAPLDTALPPGDEVHSSGAASPRSAPVSHLKSAVSGLRRAGQPHMLVLGLLTRAWLRSLTGSAGSPQAGARTGPERAQSDLDEAWEIAERGPMPLFLADIHLHRARLFGMRNSERELRIEEAAYPRNQNADGRARGPKDDLAEARRLIEKHGYWRRKEELKDAEAAILGRS